MRGFTESFNISVAASILLVDLIRKAEKYQHPDFYLSEEEKDKLRLEWYRSVVKNSDLHERVFQKMNLKN
jgi:tRNA (guanosine-2'-O-)-methyltransferase